MKSNLLLTKEVLLIFRLVRRAEGDLYRTFASQSKDNGAESEDGGSFSNVSGDRVFLIVLGAQRAFDRIY